MHSPSRSPYFAVLLLLASSPSFVACSRSGREPAAAKGPEKLTRATLAKATAGQFQPVPLPDSGIPGYKFPEAEDTIEGWTKTGNRQEVDLHAEEILGEKLSRRPRPGRRYQILVSEYPRPRSISK